MQAEHCPNCGEDLADYRTDRQAAGTRDVILSWTMCVNCKHVGLKQWSFADGILPVPPRSPKTRMIVRKSA